MRPHRAARRIACCAIATLALCTSNRSWAGETANILTNIRDDTKLYVTAPLRWDGNDWLYFASSIAAVSIAHRYDEEVRTHFLANQPSLVNDTASHSLSDAVPAAAAFLGTWAFAALSNDNDGRHEVWSMAEATALSATTGLLLKFAAGRTRPSKTDDASRWRAGGDAFPSLHTTAAFAIGTVLAESGNDEYRWVRRVLGYGIGVATAYQRLKHNQHWLSDTVAGTALGMSGARFALNRHSDRHSDRHAASGRQANIAVVPVDGGLLLTYSLPLQ